MKPHSLTLVLMTLAIVAEGCGSPSLPPPVAENTAPLKIEEWQTMAPNIKYDVETLERLKQSAPRLQTPRGWDHFYHTLLAPSRAKDLPAMAKR